MQFLTSFFTGLLLMSLTLPQGAAWAQSWDSGRSSHENAVYVDSRVSCADAGGEQNFILGPHDLNIWIANRTGKIQAVTRVDLTLEIIETRESVTVENLPLRACNGHKWYSVPLGAVLQAFHEAERVPVFLKPYVEKLISEGFTVDPLVAFFAHAAGGPPPLHITVTEHPAYTELGSDTLFLLIPPPPAPPC